MSDGVRPGQGNEAVLVARPALREASWKRRKPLLVKILSLTIFFLSWEIYGRNSNPLIFTYPTAVLAAAYELIRSGELLRYSLESFQVVLYGLALAIAFGIPFGVLMGRAPIVSWATNVYVNALYATPAVALVPLLVLWFGFRLQGKVTVVFLFAVFPLIINLYQGVRSVDRQLLEVAAAFCARERHVWRHVIIPFVTPFIVAAIRLAIGRALVGMIIADFYTSVTGLGFMIVKYANNFQIDRLFVPIVEVVIVALVTVGALGRLERRLTRWVPREQPE